MAQSAGGASARWTLGVVLVAGAWIIAFWMTPGPDPREVEVEFGPPPEARRATPAPRIDPQPVEDLDRGTIATPDPLPQEPALEEPPSATPRVTPPSFYRYKLGDKETLVNVAAKFLGDGRKWPVIAQANPMLDPNRLRPGTIVLVPVDPTNIQGIENPQGYEVYTIASGDTLSEISKKVYGKSSLWGVIAAANPDVDPNRLKVGSTLKIPPAPVPKPPGN